MILTRADLRASPIGTGLIIHKHLYIGSRVNMENSDQRFITPSLLLQIPAPMRNGIYYFQPPKMIK